MDLWLIFLTGLTVGGLTCLAVQGGLLASTAIASAKNQKNLNFFLTLGPTLVFLLFKLLGYTILGFLLGLLGQTLAISPAVQLLMQILAGVYMLLVALNILGVPFFNFGILSPPRALTEFVGQRNDRSGLLTPAILGLLTVFIPCGTTWAIEALAISSASPWIGALIMLIFVLGTTPLFLGIGFLTSSLNSYFRKNLLKLSAWVVIYLALVSINGALVAAGSPVTAQKIYDNLPFEIDLGGKQDMVTATDQTTFQQATIDVSSAGYSPDYLQVKKNEPVHLTVITNGAINCASSAFRIPELNIAQNLPLSGSREIDFTPTTAGKLTFTCPLGLYTGTIEVI